MWKTFQQLWKKSFPNILTILNIFDIMKITINNK